MADILYKANVDNNGVKASVDVPDAMRAVVALGKEGGDRRGKPLNYKFQNNFKTPQVGDNEVLLGVQYSGICHTDLLCLDGILVVQGPRVPGHEFAGLHC